LAGKSVPKMTYFVPNGTLNLDTVSQSVELLNIIIVIYLLLKKCVLQLAEFTHR